MNNEKLCVDNHSVVFFLFIFELLVNEYQNICVVLGDNCYNVGNSAAQGRVLFIHLHSVYSHMVLFFVCLFFTFNILFICMFPKGPFNCAAQIHNTDGCCAFFVYYLIVCDVLIYYWSSAFTLLLLLFIQ